LLDMGEILITLMVIEPELMLILSFAPNMSVFSGEWNLHPEGFFVIFSIIFIMKAIYFPRFRHLSSLLWVREISLVRLFSRPRFFIVFESTLCSRYSSIEMVRSFCILTWLESLKKIDSNSNLGLNPVGILETWKWWVIYFMWSRILSSIF
jgi:hypothetical protein